MSLGRSADSGQITSEMVFGSARMVLGCKDVGIENFMHSYEGTLGKKRCDGDKGTRSKAPATPGRGLICYTWH